MRLALACFLFAAIPAWSQVPDAKAVPQKGACPDCGVVRSVKAIKKDLKPTPTTESKPSGLVATVPLGKEGGKPQIGPSQRIGKDKVTTSDTWEVTIRLDDGRMRLVRTDEHPDVREGDKVLIDSSGRITRRAD